jgi:hypothetical protein
LKDISSEVREVIIFLFKIYHKTKSHLFLLPSLKACMCEINDCIITTNIIQLCEYNQIRVQYFIGPLKARTNPNTNNTKKQLYNRLKRIDLNFFVEILFKQCNKYVI